MAPVKASVLVVDDNRDFVQDVVMFLRADYRCHEAHSKNEALSIIGDVVPDAVILDISLSGNRNDEEGFEVLRELKEQYPHVAAIMVSKHDTEAKIDKALKLGADFYLPKKTGAVDLKRTIAFTLQKCFLAKSHNFLQQQQDEMIYESDAMKRVVEEAREVAGTNARVLITGETGTGKRLVAEFIHSNSLRANRPFCTVNALSLDSNLISSELFGHKRGSFTGAIADRIGKLESCNHGTVFLDEIGDYSLEVQTKLLDFLDRSVIQRLGSNKEKHVDVRIIAATNKNLETLIKEKKFREDLYFRLKVKTIDVPPLRDRKEDIAPIAYYYLQRYSIENHKFLIRFEPESIDQLAKYSWPGNIRELRHFIEGICIKAQKDTHHKKDIERRLMDWMGDAAPEPATYNYNEALANFKRSFIKNALIKTDGNVTAAAKLIGLQRESLHRIIKSLEIIL